MPKAIKNLGDGGTTVVVVTHRPSLLNVVEKILVLREGSVAMFGPRDQVLNSIRPHQSLSPAERLIEGQDTAIVMSPIA